MRKGGEVVSIPTIDLDSPSHAAPLLKRERVTPIRHLPRPSPHVSRRDNLATASRHYQRLILLSCGVDPVWEGKARRLIYRIEKRMACKARREIERALPASATEEMAMNSEG